MYFPCGLVVPLAKKRLIAYKQKNLFSKKATVWIKQEEPCLAAIHYSEELVNT